ncbi:MAG: helix-turn-helix domain-containing protein [Oribacterium sp.]
MTLIEKIERILKEKGITKYQVEKDIGIKQQSFKNWEKGSEPGVYKIIAILKYLEVSADELFEIKAKESNKISTNEQELLTYFRQLPSDRQQRELGRLEGIAGEFMTNNPESEYTKSKIG